MKMLRTGASFNTWRQFDYFFFGTTKMESNVICCPKYSYNFFTPIVQVHSDHHEVVADLVQTSFLFSIPMDGPMSFSTRYVSVQWALRFEFLTTPKNVDWTRYNCLCAVQIPRTTI